MLGGVAFQRVVLAPTPTALDRVTAADGAPLTGAGGVTGQVGGTLPAAGSAAPSGSPSAPPGSPAAATGTTSPAVGAPVPAAAGSGSAAGAWPGGIGPLAGGPTGGPAARPSGNPFAGARFYADPDSQALADAASAGGSTAAALRRLGAGPHAYWFGYADPAETTRSVAARVALIRAAGALPVLVAYGIPNRDCGGYSAGGAPDAAAYRSWSAAFAAGLGAGPAAVILEPDALAQTDCLAAADLQTRYSLLAGAVSALAAAGASVYLDAGNAGWRSAADMAARLRAAGVAGARGFALNVSNFGTTAAQDSYGDAVVAALTSGDQGSGAHFVVDTSRNGLGPASGNQWCNPPGRALGTAADAATGDPNADALYWIKIPGESDGTCNGGPPAGQW